MIRGTAHFEDKLVATMYYKSQGYSNAKAAVQEKLDSGEIFIGKPILKEGETLHLNAEEGRYFIEDKN